MHRINLQAVSNLRIIPNNSTIVTNACLVCKTKAVVQKKVQTIINFPTKGVRSEVVLYRLGRSENILVIC